MVILMAEHLQNDLLTLTSYIWGGEKPGGQTVSGVTDPEQRRVRKGQEDLKQ